MKKIFLFGIIFTTIIDLNKNILEEEIKKYMQNFLFLKNSQKYCEKDNLILAQTTDKLFNLSKVLDICVSKKTCDFISYSPKRKLRNSIFYENDEPLKNTGANWICSGDSWIFSRPRKYWITAIKDNHIKDQIKNYNVIDLNKTGECDEKNVLIKITNFITPKEVAEECNKISNCKFIIFNYNKKLGSSSKLNEKAVLCSQPPINRISKLGFFIAGKYVDSSSNQKKENKKKKKMIVNIPVGGSITPDNHYYNYNKGDLVHAEKLDY
ncbi:conserved Plasmodium protein, unknown function [Plasmodium gallinaceum]|uniref:Uncharacterized protein n=1 Tax=Plasmodium gallinaceum TaxID=5849 RepID=A0A1J1GRT4_PLAGA|nr:conserved Plasmodium protein, unknown function [Plasmodium gallinaceum]CRG95182.1 conserved Plasmodium protein, unknown function [Plasmodium gallinaceum]